MANTHLKWQLIKTILSFAVVTISCPCKSQEKWLPGMEINTYNGGGRVPESKTIIISESSGSYIHWRLPKRDTLVFALSQQELNDLLKEIDVVHFRKINCAKTSSVIHDKSTTSIEFKWAGKTHKVSDGATENITGPGAEGFYTLYSYIEELVRRKTDKGK